MNIRVLVAVVLTLPLCSDASETSAIKDLSQVERPAANKQSPAGTSLIGITVTREASGIIRGQRQMMTMTCRPGRVFFYRRPSADVAHTEEEKRAVSKASMTWSIHPESADAFKTVLNKFLEWEKLAKQQRIETFTKPIGEVDSIPYEFSWSGSGASPCARLGPIENCYIEEVEMMRGLLGQMADVQKELAERVATTAKKLEAFK